ncbi:MAG: hypothetical protein IJ147_01450 [Lachnospiraceae bacterium]|nr:hypothetical protein [Lachnospiraceae bacterium]
MSDLLHQKRDDLAISAYKSSKNVQIKLIICTFFDKSTVEAVLGKLVKAGSVRKLGTTRATKYVNVRHIKDR